MPARNPWAFPCPEDESNGRNSGMDLRDYFAAAALANMDQDVSCATIAALAYRIADAMLKERQKEMAP